MIGFSSFNEEGNCNEDYSYKLEHAYKDSLIEQQNKQLREKIIKLEKEIKRLKKLLK